MATLKPLWDWIPNPEVLLFELIWYFWVPYPEYPEILFLEILTLWVHDRHLRFIFLYICISILIWFSALIATYCRSAPPFGSSVTQFSLLICSSLWIILPPKAFEAFMDIAPLVF